MATPWLGVLLILVTFALSLMAYRAGRGLSALDHEYMIETIQHSQIREARIDESLMAVHLGITRHYDDLTARLRTQQSILTAFAIDPRLRDQIEMSGMRPRIEAIDHLIDIQEQTIERFKRHFALVRNSSRYVPMLVGALSDEAAREGQSELADTLNQLLRAALIYDAMPSLEFEQELRAQLETLTAQRKRLPDAFREALRLVDKHALILLTERINTRVLIREILDVPLEFSYQDLLRAYQSWYGERLAVATRYQSALGASSVALAGYFAFLVWQFWHSRRVIRASEQHLRNLLDSLYVFVGVMTPDGIMTEVNRAPLQLAGLRREAVIGKPVDQMFWFSHSLDARARIASAITRAARGELVRYDDRVRIAAEPMWVDLAVTPLMDEQGNVTQLVLLGVDITQRKYAENAIRESQERLRILIDYAPAAMALFDLEMRYLAVSRRWMEDYSLGERDLIGCSHYEIFPELPQRWKEAHRRALSGDVVKADMDCFPRQDGTEQWVRWEVRPWHAGDGSVGGIVMFTEDITARRQAEAEVLRLNAELEQRVEQRTAELATVNKELEAFSYSVSHDLRAPLRAMHGFSAALTEDCREQLDEGCRDYLDRIQKASEKMARLIDDLLQLSRITRAELNLQPVDLCALARQVVEGLRQRDSDRDVELLISNTCPAWGDARLLAIALDNLFSNAWKFTRNQPQPRIEFGVLRQNGESVYFMRDNGAGFDMAYADKLFIAFQRLHSDQQFEGTGIGLSIVQRVIHRHRGRVWAEAEEGKGATFYFTLAGAAQGSA